MKKIVLSLLALALVAGSPRWCAAKDDAAAQQTGNKPVAVLSLAGYDRIMEDLDFLGGLAGNPGLSKNLEGAIQLFTQGQGLAGLDKKRPWGITLTTDGASFQPLVFLPVNSLKQLLDALAGLIGEAQEGPNGTYQLSVFNFNIFCKEQDGWAYFGQSADELAALPKDPTKLLGGLDKSYDVALRLHVQNVPELYRSMLLDQLRAGVDRGMAQQDDESDEDYTARKEFIGKQLDAVAGIVNELDQLTLGWALDTTAKTTHIDLSIVGVPGSSAAKRLAAWKPTRSNFAGFLVPSAAASFNASVTIDKDTASHFVIALESLRTHVFKRIDNEDDLDDDASKTLAKEIVGEVFDTIVATVSSGKVDAGATLQLSEKSLALVAGAYVVDPKVLEDALKKLNKLLKDEPNFPGIKFDAAKYAGIRFHTVSIPVPQDQDIAKVLGGTLDVAVGIGDNTAYLALGTDSMNLLKQLIDKSKADASKQVPPLQLNVSLAPIFAFAAAMQDSPEVTAIAEKLAKAGDKDEVRLVVTTKDNALTIRIDAQEAVIELVARAIASSGAVVPGGLQ